MVGVGEATLGPAALSLLSDYFPPRMRATVQSIYSSGIAIGGGLAFFLGGWIGQTLRLALGVLPARVSRARPRRARLLPARAAARPDGVAPVARRAGLEAALPLDAAALLYAGYALFGLASNNLGIWVPTFFVRVHGMSLLIIGTAAGILSIVVGMPVMILGGWFSDRVRRVSAADAWRSPPGRRSRRSRSGSRCSSPTTSPSLIASTSSSTGWRSCGSAPPPPTSHEIAGPHLRGLGHRHLLLDRQHRRLRHRRPAHRQAQRQAGASPDAALLVCPAACAAGALLLWLGSRARANRRRARPRSVTAVRCAPA